MSTRSQEILVGSKKNRKRDGSILQLIRSYFTKPKEDKRVMRRLGEDVVKSFKTATKTWRVWMLSTESECNGQLSRRKEAFRWLEGLNISCPSIVACPYSQE